MDRRNRILCAAAFVAVITAMVGAAEVLGEREIIFPEVAALAVGCFLAPKLSWRVNYPRMVGYITLCALLGWALVVCTDWPLWIQAAVAYGVGQLVFLFSGTSLAPMLSAIVLPVLLQTESPVYPAAALALVLLLVGLRRLLERGRVKAANEFIRVPRPRGEDWRGFGFRTGFVTVFALVCLHFGGKFCMAPPLLVAFTELCRPDCPAGKRRWRVWVLVTLCALTGALCRYLLVMHWSWPATVAAAVIAAAEVLLVEGLGLYFPPAGAMGVLALLIDEGAVVYYPAQVCLGTAVLLAVSALWVRRCR